MAGSENERTRRAFQTNEREREQRTFLFQLVRNMVVVNRVRPADTAVRLENEIRVRGRGEHATCGAYRIHRLVRRDKIAFVDAARVCHLFRRPARPVHAVFVPNACRPIDVCVRGANVLFKNKHSERQNHIAIVYIF